MNLFHVSECLRLEFRGKYPFSVNMGYFSPYIYVFHMKLGLRLFFDLHISMARNFSAFDESSVYYLKLIVYHLWLYNCLESFIFITPFQLWAYLFLSRTYPS